MLERPAGDVHKIFELTAERLAAHRQNQADEDS